MEITKIIDQKSITSGIVEKFCQFIETFEFYWIDSTEKSLLKRLEKKYNFSIRRSNRFVKVIDRKDICGKSCWGQLMTYRA